MESPNDARRPEAYDEREEHRTTEFAEFSLGLASDVRAYADQQIRLLKMDASYRASDMLARALFQAALVLLGTGIALFLSLSLAWYLSALLESDILGFAAVAGVHAILLLGFILWWRLGARDRFVVARLNDLLHAE